MNFNNVQQASRKLPFGIAQIGKAFRNEITPGNFIFRTREFEQMEMEFFVPPAEAEECTSTGRRSACAGTPSSASAPTTCAAVRRRPAVALLAATFDVEYLFPIGWSELEGIANRSTSISAARGVLGREARVLRPAVGERYVPYVIEPSAGAAARRSRSCDAYDEEEVEGDTRAVLRLHPALAPVKAAVFPLVRRKASRRGRTTSSDAELRRAPVEYDEGGSIGKRYRRQDEIGTPYGVTVDHQTLEDDTVTLRDRDTLTQERIAISALPDELHARLSAPWTSPELA